MKNWQILYNELYDKGLFDHDWYTERYNDVRDVGLSPLEHYAKYGSKLGRSIKSINNNQNFAKTNTNILVSVICITYNHENFIAQALDSILSQETNFEFEVLVGNDTSSDRTGEIINEFVKKHKNYCFLK